MVFKRAVEGDITKVTDAKICVLSCPLDSMATETKVRCYLISSILVLRSSKSENFKPSVIILNLEYDITHSIYRLNNLCLFLLLVLLLSLFLLFYQTIT